MAKRKKNVLSIAVVMKLNESPNQNPANGVAKLPAGMYTAQLALALLSERKHGDWASFVGPREEVIDRAMKARERWEANGNGPYDIVVGELDAKVIVPRKYVEVAL